MNSELHEAAAHGFSSAAASYEEGRPTYPSAAGAMLARALHLGTRSLVLDLPAGPGRLTALLVGTGATVVAVEPVAEMRAVLEGALPGVRALPGTAEAIPLEAGSVDAVTVGQAFHWFRGDEALVEIHRVLRPGGGLALLWNDRDTTVGWVGRLTELMEPHRATHLATARARGGRLSSGRLCSARWRMRSTGTSTACRRKASSHEWRR